MGYRNDPDMEFLGKCTSAELEPLVHYLMCDKEGGLRATETLSVNEDYQRHQPDHRQYWTAIAAELQHFGANSIASLLRGDEGVLYREILMDVCDRMKVNYNPEASTAFIESSLLLKVLTDSLDQMDEEARRQLVDSLKLNTTSFTPHAITAALQVAVRVSGFVAYQVAVIVANAVAKQIIGRGLSIAANAALTRSLAVFAGPVGWAISGAWTLVTVTGPAFRVTIPSVVQVAFLRATQTHGAGSSGA